MTATARTFLTLGAAIAMPCVIFMSLQIASGYRAQSQAAETATLDRARRIIGDVDARLAGASAALRVATTIRSINERNWAEAYQRVTEIMALNPDWRSARFIDLAARREIFDTRRPLDGGRALDDLPDFREGAPVTIGGIEPEALGCMCVGMVAPVVRDGAARYLIAIAIGADEFQALTLALAPREGTTAVVDAQGRFISRTLAYEDRVGKPATIFVREAIARGDGGVYTGKTYEGLVNYSAFAKSPVSGWSAHVAVSSAVLDAPIKAWWTASAIAALVSLSLALGMGLLGLRAVAAQRQSVERLNQAARTEAIGKLAGGMAHDFNNMLTIIIGSLELAKRRLAAGRSDVERYVDNASEGAHRAAELTRKMLAFSRRQTLQPSAIDVNALVVEMEELLGRTLPSSIRIRLYLKATWRAFADPRELENAIVNLAVNARDAMSEGGQITISTLDAPVGHEPGGLLLDAPGDAVRITVEDTGPGMSEAVAASAFEPFFTTKPVGSGTGLGLSQVLGFARQSGGGASIEPRPGLGVRVHVVLPRAAEDGAAAPRSRAAPTPIAGGGPDDMVLIVEDEERVLKSSVEALAELGYTVRQASDGLEALEMLRREPRIRLMFTDVVMPRLDGRRLADYAAEIRPDLKILFTTGYERDPVPLGQKWLVLRKPYSFEDLARSVRDTLDA